MVETRTSLLVGAWLGNAQAWEEFYRVYAPMVLHWGQHRFGFSLDDAEDLTQEVLCAVAGSLASYRRAEGSFRAWLFGICWNRAAQIWRQSKRDARMGAPVVQEMLEAQPSLQEESRWNAIYDRDFLKAVIKKVWPELSDLQRDVLRRTWLEEESPEVTAEKLCISRGNVYLIRCRLLQKLRVVAETLEP